jgi:hypothetical protein
MRRHLVLVIVFAAISSPRAAVAETSWIFRASYFTHDPATGHRVNQFAPEKPAYVRTDPTYQESVYRHSRSGFRVGDSFDFLHTVETWGQGENIRPYGEWLFPYRAGATPFGPWGNPQGPWTTPFGSWVNPYGLGRLPNPPWFPGYLPVPYPAPVAPQQVNPPANPGASSPANPTLPQGGPAPSNGG